MGYTFDLISRVLALTEIRSAGAKAYPHPLSCSGTFQLIADAEMTPTHRSGAKKNVLKLYNSKNVVGRTNLIPDDRL